MTAASAVVPASARVYKSLVTIQALPPSMPARPNLCDWIRPVPPGAVLREPDFNVWCGSVVRGDDGRYHLFYARWPRDSTHAGWLTHSEIAHAISANPLGPYVHAGVALPRRGRRHWDGVSVFNPTVLRLDGRYVLYYTGTTGDVLSNETPNWGCRNRQRIGVAFADRPEGPWCRLDDPVIDVGSGEAAPDALMVSNPAVCARPDGGLLMLYKAVGIQAPLPFGGPVVVLVATADRPGGPFRKEGRPMFTSAGENFAAEDPFVWHDGNGYRAVVKDMRGTFTGHGCSLALFESADGSTWAPAAQPLMSTLDIVWTDGRTERLAALERPQILFEEGVPVAMFCAAADRGDRDGSFNVHIPLGPLP